MSTIQGAMWDAIGTHVHVLVTDPWTVDAPGTCRSIRSRCASGDSGSEPG
jgi:hypothetical protein